MPSQGARKLRDFEEDQIGLSIPQPLNVRLDALVEAADGAGENTSRKEVVAALLSDAPADPEQLVAVLREYRTKSVEQIVIGRKERFLQPEPKSPGPRPRRVR